ncbi:MAG TPA: peptidoglycan-binding protein, partial [Bradyrhizobium sp.]|nr:peptidoglycan-binding protein [Bradyrhizobium sp.]
MPRKIAKDDNMPRRRGARAVAVQADAERGLAMRILLHSPKDTAVGALAFAAVAAIIINALFLQRGYHPAPMFGSVVVMPATGSVSTSPLPRRRPIEPEAAVFEPRVAEPKPAE